MKFKEWEKEIKGLGLYSLYAYISALRVLKLWKAFNNEFYGIDSLIDLLYEEMGNRN